MKHSRTIQLEKKWIAILNYLDSAENQIESNKSPKRYTTNEVINSISPFNSFLAEAKYIMYNFNKKNTYNFLKNKCTQYVTLIYNSFKNNLLHNNFPCMD